MDKSNHQKHGFHPLSKWARRGRKDFWTISEIVRHDRWNGRPNGILASGKTGIVESIRFIETR